MRSCNCPGCERERQGMGGYQPCQQNRPVPPPTTEYIGRHREILEGVRAKTQAMRDSRAQAAEKRDLQVRLVGWSCLGVMLFFAGLALGKNCL